MVWPLSLPSAVCSDNLLCDDVVTIYRHTGELRYRCSVTHKLANIAVSPLASDPYFWRMYNDSYKIGELVLDFFEGPHPASETRARGLGNRAAEDIRRQGAEVNLS